MDGARLQNWYGSVVEVSWSPAVPECFSSRTQASSVGDSWMCLLMDMVVGWWMGTHSLLQRGGGGGGGASYMPVFLGLFPLDGTEVRSVAVV